MSRSPVLPAVWIASTLALVGLAALSNPAPARGRVLHTPEFEERGGFGMGEFGMGEFEGRFGMGGFGMAGFAQFQLDDAPLGKTSAPAIVPHLGSHGGTVTVDGEGLLILDRDTGKLVRSDRAGQVSASLSFGSWAGELVRDGASEFAYVADRSNHRVVRVRAAGTLEVVDNAKVREPHGLALSPDGATLYVTSVADHQLVALDTETMQPRWRVELAAEPRGVAVSASGTTAIVGFLATGAVASVDLGASGRPSVSYIGLDPAQRLPDPFTGMPLQPQAQQAELATSKTAKPSIADTQDLGLRFARNTYAVGFIGDEIAIAPHQLSAPHLPSAGGSELETYGGGGGFTAPITHRMAMIASEDRFAPATAFAQIGVHQPRALAYDPSSDTLYLAGYGNDEIMALAEASRASIHLSWVRTVDGAEACGPDGLAVAGEQLFVHCELSRSLVTFELGEVATLGVPGVHASPAIGPSTRSAAAQRGAELFRRGQDPRLSVGGFMACGSCHAEGRTDGLSWRIEGHNLQTPMLSGRLVGTHPFKWDGQDADLPTSLSATVGRLGGSGLSASEVSDLQAFLESLPQPVPPSPRASAGADAIARGQALFESSEAACSACHSGPGLADGVQHELETNIGKVDTPSLIGLAHTAPYYHDGSARTLRALLTNKGSIHDMGATAHLDSAEIDDLIAYLESL
jgi:cytochrome c553